MHSCIYEGTVRHRRFAEAEHGFRRSLFLMYLDLSELDEVFSRYWLWSSRRPAVGWFRREDYSGDRQEPLDESIRKLVQAQTGHRPSGAIRLLTHLRYFGYIINPVSFYYCFAPGNGTAVEWIVAEVTNTPWGERHHYIIDARQHDSDGNLGDKQLITADHNKSFHVSPFLPMDMQYHWRISVPGERLAVSIQNLQGGQKQFDATMVLQRLPINRFQLGRVLLKHPWMTAEVATSIYWQALRLWWKKVTFFPHPNNRPEASPRSGTQTVDGPAV
ncbi:MAG: DUF1365 domain-containing protein [Planctomycetaceae bacterium]